MKGGVGWHIEIFDRVVVRANAEIKELYRKANGLQVEEEGDRRVLSIVRVKGEEELVELLCLD